MEFIDPAGQDGAGATFPTGHEIDRLDANEAIGKKIRASTRGSLVSPRVLSESMASRHHPYRFEQPSDHAQKADLPRQSESGRRGAPLLAHPPLVPGKPEERLNLEAAQIARQRPPPQPRRLPVVHMLTLPAGRHHSPPEKPNSNRLTLLGNLASASRITEKSYRDFLRQNQAEPCDGVRDWRAHKLHPGGLKRSSHRMPRRATFRLSAPRWSVVRNARLRAD